MTPLRITDYPCSFLSPTKRVGGSANTTSANPCRSIQSRASNELLIAFLLFSFYAFVSQTFAQSTHPGMGAILYADSNGTGVTFRVWAPNATNVSVPGSFNGWNTSAHFLTNEPGTGLWSRDIPTAHANDEYKYYINRFLWKRDPRGRKVVNSAGNSIVYDPNAFTWAGDTSLPVTAPNTVIYEMHVGAFYDPSPSSGGPGKFSDAITKLNYLTNLGVTAVELMPIAEFAGDRAW